MFPWTGLPKPGTPMASCKPKRSGTEKVSAYRYWPEMCTASRRASPVPPRRRPTVMAAAEVSVEGAGEVPRPGPASPPSRDAMRGGEGICS